MKAITAVLVLVSLCFVSGCGEEFAAGFGTGAAAMRVMADDAQEKFIVAVNELNVETKRLNTEISAVKEIDVEAFIKPGTVTAIESIKDRAKDPVTWAAILSLLANGVWAGRTIEKRKATP